MTLVDADSTVVYEIALCEHPLVVGEDDDRTDAELIAWVEERFEVTDDALSWPEWMVMKSGPPNAETLRYVNLASRINVKAEYTDAQIGPTDERIDTFEEVYRRIDFDDECYPAVERPELSHWGPTHCEDFDGKIHLDLTDTEDTQ